MSGWFGQAEQSPSQRYVLERANTLIRKLGLDVSRLWKLWDWKAIGAHHTYNSAVMEDFRNIIIPHYRYYDAVSSAHLDNFLVDAPRDEPILDLGAGSGNHAIHLIRDLGFRMVILVDIAPERLRLAQEKIEAESLSGRATFMVADLTKATSFELTARYWFALGGVLSYSSDLAESLVTVARCLRSGGQFLCNLHSRAAELKHAVWEGDLVTAERLLRTGRFRQIESCTPSEMSELMSAAGFRSVSIGGQYFFFLPESPVISSDVDRLVEKATAMDVQLAFNKDFRATGSYLIVRGVR